MVSSIHGLDEAAALARWRALWEDSPQRSCFSTPAYARAVAEAFGLEGVMHLVRDDAADVAGLLVYTRRHGPYREALVPAFTPYTPVLLAPSQKEADVPLRRSAFEALLTDLEARYHVVRLFASDLVDVRPAQWRGWRATPYYSYQLVLEPEQDLTAAWSSGTRQRYRKARDAYDVAEEATSTRLLARLVAESYHRHDRPAPAPEATLAALVERLIDENLVRVWTAASREGEPEAALAISYAAGTAGYWLGGARPGPAMTVLLGSVVEQLQAEGFQRFDFIGANTPPIAVFKRQFGGDLTTYFHLEKIMRPELRLYYALKSL